MSCFRKWCVIITEKRGFELFILGSILMNTVALASHHFMISEDAQNVITVLNAFFITIFTIEAVIKITALRREYFKQFWNKFDITVLSLTFLVLIPISLGYG